MKCAGARVTQVICEDGYFLLIEGKSAVDRKTAPMASRWIIKICFSGISREEQFSLQSAFFEHGLYPEKCRQRVWYIHLLNKKLFAKGTD